MPIRIHHIPRPGMPIPDQLDAVEVGPGSEWANPFSVTQAINAGEAADETEGREVVNRWFREWVEEGKRSELAFPRMPHWYRDDLEQLRGKDLWCIHPLGAPCHADVLIELANRAEANR